MVWRAESSEMIKYGCQEITEEDISAVVGALTSEFLTQGPLVSRFEQAVASQMGAKYAVAVNSATSALHIACLSLGLGPGDYLWTSPITFVASANCALYCGASVDFVDIDPRTYNLSPVALEAKLIEAEKAGKLPKILVPVHLCGQSCDMEAIHALSQRYGFRIIEDASHAIGGKYKGQYVGNCRYSDITVFSFHPVKIITTAEGGMALTNDPALAERMELLRSHGITRDPARMTHEPDGPWYYQQIDLGFNYRMTELQAALGLSQLLRLDSYVAKRNEIASKYHEDFAATDVVVQSVIDSCYSSFHLYVVRVSEGRRGEIFLNLRSAGIGVNVHYIPVPAQPFFKNLGFSLECYPEAEAYYSQCISLPLHVGIGESQRQFISTSLQNALV